MFKDMNFNTDNSCSIEIQYELGIVNYKLNTESRTESRWDSNFNKIQRRTDNFFKY